MLSPTPTLNPPFLLPEIEIPAEQDVGDCFGTGSGAAKKMRFIDEIGILERKVNQIDRPTQDGRWAPGEVDIIETAFWARSVLDVLKNVNLHRYGHNLKTTIRTTRSIGDPDHPGSAKAVYQHNINISLKELLDFVVHFRYFAFNRHADGNHCLDVMSDRNVRQQVYYSDFMVALRSLVLSKRLVHNCIN